MAAKRHIQLMLFATAWGAFVVSLFTPGARYHALSANSGPFAFLYALGWDPVGGMLIGWIIAVCRSPVSVHLFTVIALALFILAPSLLARSSSRSWSVAKAVAAIGMIGVWIFPLHFYANPHPGTAAGEYFDIAWGYYLFAGAITIALVAVELACFENYNRAALRYVGFPVVHPHNSEQGVDPSAPLTVDAPK